MKRRVFKVRFEIAEGRQQIILFGVTDRGQNSLIAAHQVTDGPSGKANAAAFLETHLPVKGIKV